MGEECIHEGQKQLQAARLFMKMLRGEEEEGGNRVNFETDTMLE